MNLTERSLQFLTINSISQEGNEEICNYLIPIYESLQAKVILQQVFHSVEGHSKRQFNAIGILGDDLVDARTQKGLLLLTHVDTPSPGNIGDWKRLNSKPWVPQVDRGEIIGLGAADAKLDLLCKIEAARNFVNRELQQPLYIVATCGAESPLMGAKYLIQSKIVNPKYVIVGAPTDLSIVNCHNSKLVLSVQLSFVSVDRDTQEFNTRIKISTRGRSCHASHPALGDSAVAKIFDLLRFLKAEKIPMKLYSVSGGDDMNRIPDTAEVSIVIPDLGLDDFRRKFKRYLNEHPNEYFELKFGGTGSEGVRLFPEELTEAVFQIEDVARALEKRIAEVENPELNPSRSTLSINAIFYEKDMLTFQLHLSLLPEVSSPEQRKEVETFLQVELDRISQGFRRLSFRFRRVIAAPPMYTDESSTFVRTLKAAMGRAGIAERVIASPTFTEAAFFSERGIASVAFGAGALPRKSHGPDESNEIAHLEAATRFYTQAIDSFCVRGT